MPNCARATSWKHVAEVRGRGEVAVLVELAAAEPGPAAEDAAAAHAAAEHHHAVAGAVVGPGRAVDGGGAPELGGDHEDHVVEEAPEVGGEGGRAPGRAAGSRWCCSWSWFEWVSNPPVTFT